jgi:hypothetical protein
MKNNLLSKLALTIMLSVVLCWQNADAQSREVSFDDYWAKQGISLSSQSAQQIRLNVSLENYTFQEEIVDNESMETVILPGVFLPGEEGAPDLPVYSRYIAVPQGATLNISIERKRTESNYNVLIAPAPVIPKDDEPGPMARKKNQAIYGNNSFYPENIIQVSEKKKIRGIDMYIISVSPFQYNPVTLELLIHRDIEISVKFEGGNGHFGEDRLRSRYWEPIIRDMAINEASIPPIQNKKTSSRSDDECEYLIITPDDNIFKAWADSIRIFRTKEGILTNVMTTAEVGGNTTTAIDNFVKNAYNNWSVPPAAVLLMGDYGTSGNTIISPIYNNYCASDNIYADVDNDHLPDVVFARMTAQNQEHLETMVTKFLNYERNPPTNPDFYEHPITAMGWQTERWFQLCSEIVAGYFENAMGKSPVRENAIYQGNPDGGTWSTATNTATIINYFGSNGLQYIPDTPDFLDDWGGNPTRINNDINDGAFILQHRDHGYEQGWGEPAYSSSDINGLTNEDLTFVFSVNCLTGKFNMSGECFTEKFHRHEYGALGLIAATEVSYSFVNDAFVWGMYDNLWPDFMPAFGTTPESRDVRPGFGNAAGKYFLEQSNWPYNTNNKEVTYNLFHHHGDAFSIVYYEVPEYLTIVHDEVILSGMDNFNITANAGAFICLSVGDNILATAEATGSPLDIYFIPQATGTLINIVITKQNYYRYENQLEVIPPDGPYCMYKSHSLNDSLGNNNHKADFNEEVFVNIGVKNLGSEDAINVTTTISTTSSFVDFIDATEVFDTILIGEICLASNAYKIHLSDAIPDQTQVRIDLVATDEQENSWESKFFFVVSAPKLTVGEMLVDDSELGNNNGRLDPGETAELKVKTTNKGHCVAKDVVCTLTAFNQFITVNTDEVILPTLSTFGAAYPKFNVTVAVDAPEAVMAEMHYTIASAGYEAGKAYFPKIGIFLEDWETGNFNKYEWINGGTQPWIISTDLPYEGTYNAASGNINNNQKSSFMITYEVMNNDNIQFYKKVSSQLDYDQLKFFINGTQRAAWSGTSQGWTLESFPVSPGTNTFKWEYSKNSSGEAGSDKAWVDYIVLPTRMVTTLFAGPDDEICETLDFQCLGTATNHTSVNWATSGTGNFSNNEILKPVYFPSEEDYQNGSVALTLNIIDNDGETFSDELTLEFRSTPNAPATPTGPDYVDLSETTISTYYILNDPGATGYNWLLEPAEAGEININDTSALINWNTEFLGEVWLSASLINSCGTGDFSDPLMIIIDNTVGLISFDDNLQLIIAPNPNNGNFKIIIRSNESTPVDWGIMNYLGANVLNGSSQTTANRLEFVINQQDLPPGMYLLVVKQNNKFYSKKLLINN